MVEKKEQEQEEPKNKVGLHAKSIEIVLTDGSKLVSINSDHASDIYRWWCQCEEFAGLNGHRYPLNKELLKVIPV